jgi:hypothetical protein
MRRLAVVCFLLTAILSYGKSKSMSDYSTKFTVATALYDQPFQPSTGDVVQDQNYKCNMTLEGSDGHTYGVYSSGFCTTFSPGDVVDGRFTSFWGVRMIELAWTGAGKGKIKSWKYTIRAAYK